MALRPATPDDGGFLRDLFVEDRADEFASLGWAPEAVQTLLEQQHALQSAAYRRTFPGATEEIVLLDGQPIGRLCVDRTGTAIHVVDITLGREHRGRGIGTGLLRGLKQEADARRVPVRLTALRGGRAAALYARLGFVARGGDDVHLELEWPVS